MGEKIRSFGGILNRIEPRVEGESFGECKMMWLVKMVKVFGDHGINSEEKSFTEERRVSRRRVAEGKRFIRVHRLQGKKIRCFLWYELLRDKVIHKICRFYLCR